MPKGISIHIGVDYVDESHYGTEARLPCCEQDALAMQKIARSCGFEPFPFINKSANSNDILYFLNKAAASMERGDILFLSFSGHGGYLQDINLDETENDRYDEVWLLYDRMLVDDELYITWSKFKPGVRILVISDSCHSGTVTKSWKDGVSDSWPGKEVYKQSMVEESQKVYSKNRFSYNRILKTIPSAIPEIACSVILLAACQDDQKAFANEDGREFSIFTDKLLITWNKGSFNSTYRVFCDVIRQRMPKHQVPNYFFIGSPNIQFENQKPFTI